jgi:hypothetical protein
MCHFAASKPCQGLSRLPPPAAATPLESNRRALEQALDFAPMPRRGHRSRSSPRTLNFSDSDWTRDPPPRQRLAPAQRRAVTLAIAIAVSCLALALALYGIEQMVDSAAHGESLGRVAGSAALPAAGVPPLPASAPVAGAASRPLEAPAAVPPSAAETTADEVDARQMQALEAEMRQRAKDNAELAAQDAARRKQRAWERYYQAPAFCSDNPTPAQMVQCANHHIRARKEFEERFGAGRL